MFACCRTNYLLNNKTPQIAIEERMNDGGDLEIARESLTPNTILPSTDKIGVCRRLQKKTVWSGELIATAVPGSTSPSIRTPSFTLHQGRITGARHDLP